MTEKLLSSQLVKPLTAAVSMVCCQVNEWPRLNAEDFNSKLKINDKIDENVADIFFINAEGKAQSAGNSNRFHFRSKSLEMTSYCGILKLQP